MYRAISLHRPDTRYIVAMVCIAMALLSGCTAVSTPLPTRMAIAAVPNLQEQPHLPATFTAVPPATTIPTPAPTQPPTATPLPSPTATLPPPTPTSPLDVIPAYLRTNAVAIPYRDAPPATVPCDAGMVFRSRFPSAVGGPWRTYSAYLPPCYGQDGRSYPVLYLFHGSIQTDSHWADLGLATYADRGITDGRYPPFIAVMPFNGELGNKTSGGGRSIEAVTVNHLLPFVDETFCTWQARDGRSLGGISRGGYWALMIAFRHTGLFTAVSGHSSHLRFATDAATYNPLATYAEADLSAMRIWMDWGETDFLRPGQQQLHQSLTDAGIAHEAHVNGGGHSDTYWRVHLQAYLDWHTAVWPSARTSYPLCQT